MVARKRIMVVVDRGSGARHATLWALNHVAGAADVITLLHVRSSVKTPSSLAHSLVSLCKSCRPEVEVEALSVLGPKLPTVLSQISKLQVSVLVLSQTKPSSFSCFLPTDGEDFVERCIEEADCLAMAVRKRGGGVGGWYVSTRWQKNFWLLA